MLSTVTTSDIERRLVDLMESRQTAGQFHLRGILGSYNLDDYFPGIKITARQVTPDSVEVSVSFE